MKLHKQSPGVGKYLKYHSEKVTGGSLPNANQQPQHKICPKCGSEVKVYETGRSLCTKIDCPYEGPGILRASAA